MDFVTRLEQYMEDNNLRQVDIANITKKSRGTISNILKGKKGISNDFLSKLSEYSGKSINWWLHGNDNYDNLYSLNELINLFIKNGTIKKDVPIDKDTMDILITMLKKEINVKLDKIEKAQD